MFSPTQETLNAKQERSVWACCFQNHDPLLQRWTKTGATLGSQSPTRPLFWPGIPSRVKPGVVWGNLITAAVKVELLHPGEPVRVCTVNAVCRKQAERTSHPYTHDCVWVSERERKKKSVIIERWKDLSFSKCSCIFFAFWEKKCFTASQWTKHLLVSHCQLKAGLQLTTILTVD